MGIVEECSKSIVKDNTRKHAHACMHAHGMEVASPRKTWKMAGRPDKSGKRTELTIGLFNHCGKSFRAVLAKRKI